MLDTLLADMEAFSDDKNHDKKARDLENKVDLLTDKLKTAFDPETDMTNFRWSLSDEDTTDEKMGHCSACKKYIEGKSVLVGEESFHQTCFVCFHCGDRLDSKYYQVDGKNYCETDREVSLPRCSSCHLPLQSGCLTVGGVSFHPHCFVCSICGNPIMGKFITKDDGKYVCEEDFKQSQAKCDHCGLPMLDRVLTAINKKFHPVCFSCCQCGEGLDGVQFMVEGGAVYCTACYSRYKAVQCTRCGQGIVAVAGSGQKTTVITCESNNYHQQCYSCLRCGKSLVGQHVFLDMKEDEVTCGDCHK